MGIADHYKQPDPVISFEFFPPKTDVGYRSLFRTIEELKPLSPGFVSVTMGAGGSTRTKTVELTIEITREIGLVTMCHLPCTGFRPHEVGSILDQLDVGGVHNVLALRGDPPADDPDFVLPSDGFKYANELVEYIADRGIFSIGAACCPEVHPGATDAVTDLANLKRKVDAGTNFLVSQLFLDNSKFFDFVDRARAAADARLQSNGARDTVGKVTVRHRERGIESGGAVRQEDAAVVQQAVDNGESARSRRWSPDGDRAR